MGGVDRKRKYYEREQSNHRSRSRDRNRNNRDGECREERHRDRRGTNSRDQGNKHDSTEIRFTEDQKRILLQVCEERESRRKNSFSRSATATPLARVVFCSYSTPLSHEQLTDDEADNYKSRFGGYLRCVNHGRYKSCVTIINDRFGVSNSHIVVYKEYSDYKEAHVKLCDKTRKLEEDGKEELAEEEDVKFRKWVNEKQSNLRGKEITVYKTDGSSPIQTKIFELDFFIDYIVLRAEKGGLLDEGMQPLELGSAADGNNYILFGLPMNNKQNPFVLKGHIANASPKTHWKGYIFGAYGSDNDYSGGPVIRLGFDNKLLGIVVGAYRITLSDAPSNKELTENFNKLGTRAPLAHIIPAEMFASVLYRNRRIDNDEIFTL